VPFAQIFQVKCEVEGESLGILTHAATPEIKEIIAGSPAAQAGINPKEQRSCTLSKKEKKFTHRRHSNQLLRLYIELLSLRVVGPH
jgi:hypothetical protein